MADYNFIKRDSAGRPRYYVMHHETHRHNGMCPHEHWIDLSNTTLESIMKKGDFYKRKDLDVRPASWS